MTHKISILTMVLLALAMAGIGVAGAAYAAATPAKLAWSPTNSLGTYDYGTLATGTTKSVRFTLTNAGGKATGRLRITLSGPSAFTITQDRCSGRSLGPNKSCTVPVQYAPKSSGQRESATLSASGMSARVSLTLIGQAGVGGTPNLTISPGTFLETVDGTKLYDYGFGDVQSGSSKTTTFTVTNSGASSSETLFIQCGSSVPQPQCPPNQPFSLNHNTCTNTSLAANGGSCTFDLEFTGPPKCHGTAYNMDLKVIGTDVTYIGLTVSVTCSA